MGKKHRNGNGGEKPITFVARPNGWKQIQISPFIQSIDPTKPVAYITDVQGQRHDDVVFKVRVALDKRKIDMIPTQFHTIQICREAIQNGLNQLQTFRDCECTLDTSCKEHMTQ